MKDQKTVPLSGYMQSDATFNRLFPPSIQLLAARHWTPLHVARLATEFLCSGDECRILDIGSGVGKFCLAGAIYAPQAHFFGIEQRHFLVDHAQVAKNTLRLKNVSFIEGNFTGLDIRRYHHFYFYNSFYENIDDSDRIDERICHSYSLYQYYVRYLYNGLKSMPPGTRIATYHTLWDEMPGEYRLMETMADGALNFWMKQ